MVDVLKLGYSTTLLKVRTNSSILNGIPISFISSASSKKTIDPTVNGTLSNLLLSAIQPIYVSAIPDRRPARMRDLPIEKVDGEISRKWTERYNVDDQDGRPLSLAFL